MLILQYVQSQANEDALYQPGSTIALVNLLRRCVADCGDSARDFGEVHLLGQISKRKTKLTATAVICDH